MSDPRKPEPTFAERFKEELNKPKSKHSGWGCLSIIIAVLCAGWFIDIAGCNDNTDESDKHKAGRMVGYVDGNMAMHGAAPRETDAEKERTAWSIASQFSDASDQDKQNWVNGYKEGWDNGYDTH